MALRLVSAYVVCVLMSHAGSLVIIAHIHTQRGCSSTTQMTMPCSFHWAIIRHGWMIQPPTFFYFRFYYCYCYHYSHVLSILWVFAAWCMWTCCLSTCKRNVNGTKAMVFSRTHALHSRGCHIIANIIFHCVEHSFCTQCLHSLNRPQTIYGFSRK